MSKPMFQKRHCEALAKSLMGARPLRYGNPSPGLERSMCNQWYTDVFEIASMLIADNPKFDNNRFTKACGADV